MEEYEKEENREMVQAFFDLAEEIDIFLSRCDLIEVQLGAQKQQGGGVYGPEYVVETGLPKAVGILQASRLGLHQRFHHLVHHVSKRNLIARPPISDKTN